MLHPDPSCEGWALVCPRSPLGDLIISIGPLASAEALRDSLIMQGLAPNGCHSLAPARPEDLP